jgi:hypothetical protein
MVIGKWLLGNGYWEMVIGNGVSEMGYLLLGNVIGL